MTRPRYLHDIPTPALVIDLATMDRNIRRMAEFFASGACRLRPHFKAHKTPEIARRQLAAGSCSGLTCATVSEAEVAAELCDDLLVANQVRGWQNKMYNQLIDRDRKIQTLQEGIAEQERLNSSLHEQAAAQEAYLQKIGNSRGWRLLQAARRLKSRLFR